MPAHATEFTITDTLVKGLEFADQDGNPTTDPKKAVRSIKVKGANNHLPGKDGTVSENAGEYVLDKLSQMKKGDKLCIKMSDGIEALAARFCSLDTIAEGYSNYELITYLNPTVGDMVVEVQEE